MPEDAPTFPTPAPLRRRLRTGLSLVAAGALSSVALAAVTTTAAQAAPSPATTVQMSVTTGGFAPGWGANDASSNDSGAYIYRVVFLILLVDADLYIY